MIKNIQNDICVFSFSIKISVNPIIDLIFIIKMINLIFIYYIAKRLTRIKCLFPLSLNNK